MFSTFETENNTYWQLKAVKALVTKGREITDHKEAAWLAFDITVAIGVNQFSHFVWKAFYDIMTSDQDEDLISPHIVVHNLLK